ncbi:universal stress protein [Pontimicrobium aquaticum]|uniref:Universal stress protein n=1 Tax=Pontimicrobium aquaticum TaxID=2565367 RepID=A0A4U0EVB7_9FLAO|nr:universal stress protein [Pontimicrobium aquaticum]TJY35783.1 universal stress protein [Pontimicrobium aquaticum]
MKKVLLPTDFSENSWNAIQYALQLFKDQECHFVLLNTYTPIIYQVEYWQPSSAQLGIVDALKKTSKNRLDELHEKIILGFKDPKHTFSQISSINNLTSEIDNLYSNSIMDIIVMGTKGASGVAGVLFGSNTIHVIKNAKCPVLAIPSGFDFENPHEILFPTDYEIEYKNTQLNPIIEIAKKHISRINILHVFAGNGLTKTQEKNKSILETSMKGIAHLFHDVKNQNVPEAITNFQLKSRVNLLIMINNKRSFFENLFFKSTINHIGFHLNIPFMVIPSRK